MSSDEKNIEQNNFGVINVRLKSIEATLSDLKDLLIKVPIMVNDMADLERRTTTAETNIDVLAKEVTHLKESCKSITEMRVEIKSAKEELNNLKLAPIQKNAGRWNSITDYIFKGLVAAACIYLFSKGGFN